METTTRVTVGIPAYNAAPWLDEAIESARTQDFPDWEMIIVDDGSTDETGTIADAWARRDSRIRVLHTENSGGAAARNATIAACRTPFLAWFDADDISLPGRLSAQIAFLDARPDIAAVGGQLIKWFPETGKRQLQRKPRGKDRIRNHLLRKQENTPLPTGTLMVRTEALRAVGGCRPFFSSGEDLDLNIRLVEQGFALDNLPDPVLLFRQTPDSLSRGDPLRTECGTILAFESSRARREGRADPIASMEPPSRPELIEQIAIPPERRAWAYGRLLMGFIWRAWRTSCDDIPIAWVEAIIDDAPVSQLELDHAQLALAHATPFLIRVRLYSLAARALLASFRIAPARFVCLATAKLVRDAGRFFRVRYQPNKA